MAKKKRCGNCKDYFVIEGRYPKRYCSNKCKDEAWEKDRHKKYLKAKAQLEKKTTKDKKPRKKKKEKTPRQIAKEAAWNQFSIYIRTRDCIRFTGKPDEGKCITCGRPYPFKKLQAGHFIPGRGNAVLFDERIVYSQCIGCNGNPPYGKGGNYIEYFVFMEHEWGRDMIDEFRALRHSNVKYSLSDLENIKELYKTKTEELLLKLK